MLKFIDISGHQKCLVLSNLVGQIDAVMLKATEGTGYVEPLCDQWFQQAKRYGLCLAVYHYGRNNDAKAECDYFLDNCINYFNGKDAHAIPALDWEEGQSVEWVNAFVERFHSKTGIWPWVYANASTFREKIGVNENCGRWVAAWPGGAMTFAEAEEYGVQDRVPGLDCAWQFTNEGRLKGYSGNLDMDLFYGDKATWEKYALGDNKGAAEDVETEMKQVLENDTYKVTIEAKDK